MLVESDIVDERVKGLEATRAILLQQAVLSVLSKEGTAAFRKSIENLSIELKGL